MVSRTRERWAPKKETGISGEDSSGEIHEAAVAAYKRVRSDRGMSNELTKSGRVSMEMRQRTYTRVLMTSLRAGTYGEGDNLAEPLRQPHAAEDDVATRRVTEREHREPHRHD